jgi:hypothetical protein
MEQTDIGKAKAIREGYAPAPFFFRQAYQPRGERWVAWTSSLPDLQALFYRVLSCFPAEVEVLLKLSRDDGPAHEGRSWRQFYGACDLEEVSAAVRAQEALAFVDGGSQLCVRCAGGDDYLALDEHGIFFLYAEDDGLAALCEEFGFERRAEQLLYEAGHWHYRPGQVEQGWQRFVRRLGLQEV